MLLQAVTLYLPSVYVSIYTLMFCETYKIKTCVRHRDCFGRYSKIPKLFCGGNHVGLAYKNMPPLHLSMGAANYCIIYRVESHVQVCLMTGHNSRVQDRTQVISTSVSLSHYPPGLFGPSSLMN